MGSVLGGYFALTLGARGPTRRIRYDASPEQLQVALELDLAIDRVYVSRTKNTYCACENGYEWIITFDSMEGDVEVLTAISSLTGDGASVGDMNGGNQAVVLTESPVLGGTFVLQYDTASTENLPHNIDPATLSTRLSTDLGLSIRQ